MRANVTDKPRDPKLEVAKRCVANPPDSNGYPMDMARRHLLKRVLASSGGLALAGLSVRSAMAQAVGRFRTGGAGAAIFDHAAFDSLLGKYGRLSRDGIVRLDYAAWTGTAPDRAALRGYIDALAAFDPIRLTRDEQFAFWANLYNALTLDVVLQAYPVTSIRQIRPSLLSTGPWRKTVVRVLGVDLSLDAIEQDILRKGWRDPRVHYAVNCASISCPNLPLIAWRGAGLSPALDAAARAYVNHPRGVRFDGDGLVVSSIYHWYAADFGGSDASVIAHLTSFAAAPLRARLDSAHRIARDDYDWSLNVAPVRR